MRGEFPFEIDRTSTRGLVDQLVGSVRDAIASGRLKEGAALPGFREIARRLNVSIRVPRDAIERLSREGLVCSRRGLGTFVCGGAMGKRHWRVLLLHQETRGSYFLNLIFETLGMRLSRQGITVVREVVPYLGRGKQAIEGVRSLLVRERFDCAFVMLYEDEYFSLLERFGIPYVAGALRPKRYPGASGLILNSYRTACGRFAAVCRRRKVRRILQVSCALDVLDMREVFRDKGIDVETINIPGHSWDDNIVWERQMTTRKMLGERLDRGNLPDVIVFFDDYVSRGGLIALRERGIRFPDDVGVVVWSNKGDDVMSERPLTSFTLDVPKWADKITDEFLRFIRTGTFAKGLVVGPVYKAGESF